MKRYLLNVVINSMTQLDNIEYISACIKLTTFQKNYVSCYYM